jgi:hypothetical protein
VSASIIGRRAERQDRDIKFRFQPVEPKASPITSLWVSVPKDVYDSLPESDATLPVVYAKGAPDWYDLKVRLDSATKETDHQFGSFLVIAVGLCLPGLGIACSYWLCFAADRPLAVSCHLGCLNDTKYDSSSGNLTIQMNYRTVPRTYDLETKSQIHDSQCSFCGKPIKVRIASRHEARLPAVGTTFLAVLSGFMIAVLAEIFWAERPAWYSYAMIALGIAIAAIVFCIMWTRPFTLSVVRLIEGRGNLVHSKTLDDGNVVKWYEHEILK